MKLQLPKASTSVILTVFIQDSSSSTGAGLGGLDQTSSITGGYVKRNGTGVALTVDENVTTEGTYQAPSTAAKVRIGAPANLPAGFYELHFHNDLFTTADWVTMGFAGASNMAPLTLEIQLTGVDLNDADDGGMSVLAAWANGGRLDNLLDAIPTTMRGTDSVPTNPMLATEDGSNLTAIILPANGIPAAALSAAAVAKIEAALLNEGDGQALIDAIVQAIDAADIENDVLPALVRDAILNRVLAGNHDTVNTVGKILQNVLAKTDGLNFTGNDVKATLDGESVITDAASRTASQATGFATPGDEMAMSAAERNALADAVLTRDVSNVEATAGDHSLCYVALAMSESNTTANAGKLTVFRTDGVTEFVQKPITTDAAADPITGVQ